MIDPRFANPGAIPVETGYEGHKSSSRRHHRRHHRHRKNKHGIVGESPLSRDESIHKVDHIEGASIGTGFGVPFSGNISGGFFQQQHMDISNHGETSEQLVDQRSPSALNNEVSHVRPSISPVGAEARHGSHHRHHRGHHHSRHHHHHHQHHQHHQHYVGHTYTAGGYGHVSDDIIFIERGRHGHHHQAPPPGFIYKGMIQVQGCDTIYRSRSRSRHLALPPPAPVRPINLNPCPPGWQLVNGVGGNPCPPGTTLYTGQTFGGYGTLGSYGSGGHFNLGSGFPYPPCGQLVADYIVEPSAGGFITSGDGGYMSREREERVPGRPTIIEVWQRRPRSPTPIRSRSRTRSRSRSRSRTRSPHGATAIDLERLRSDLLIAIERITQGIQAKIHLIGHEGGTQTHPIREIISERERTPGEVRVIVQPIQPVFYMPRQTEVIHQQPAPYPQIIPQIIPIQQPTPIVQPAPAPQIVYVPRNVYVPVIKPVFVPRERVIVRPQVVHVARPVLVDRPVPVTQRPIIIDRERPVPVPVRTVGVGRPGGARTIREEYVYRDNLPVAYGGRCPEYAGGIHYGYMPTQQEHQYATSSVHEVLNNYPAPGPVLNVPAPNPYQYHQAAAQYNLNQGGGVYGGYTDVVGANTASVVNGLPLECTGPIEVLDATINPSWQRTDKATLLHRFGRPAYDIVQQTDQIEQQILQGTLGVQRTHSMANYGAGSGYSSFAAGNINNLNLGGVVHGVGAPIDPYINY
ncbi:unnamed protein product [Rotaria sordida]|uniref:Uncharacterized protein n=1 Tax=Rotaria sordida TaxID=392033 RepID=A0A813Y5N5_9BILA|nr:unnamed protein product [Rotaria sordida]CAF0832083.1 unnamed protein product [Rotaria sordida]CAF0876423.1 unnamed protein product [Rotaria sordida]CAF0902541.1 unnamed protein product [Rotaria sordida]CAF3535634.1 unnamed protein product [Rotaria sordida]